MPRKARCHSQSPPLPAHLLQTMSPEDFQGPQGAEVPRMPDPGVLQHRGAAGQPAARASPGRGALGARLRQRGLLPQARRAGLAGWQEKQDSARRSAVQPFPAGAEHQSPHGWGKKDLICSHHRVHLEAGFVCIADERFSSFSYISKSAAEDSLGIDFCGRR